MRNIYPRKANLKIRGLTPIFSAIILLEVKCRHFCPSEISHSLLWQFYWSWGQKALVNALTTPLTLLWILKSVASHWVGICQVERSQVHWVNSVFAEAFPQLETHPFDPLSTSGSLGSSLGRNENLVWGRLSQQNGWLEAGWGSAIGNDCWIPYPRKFIPNNIT